MSVYRGAAPLDKLTSPTGRYYIQHTIAWDGSSVTWWRPNKRGYTSELDSAGIYTEKEARAIESLRGQERAIPYEVAQAAASRHVRSENLDRALAHFRKRDTSEAMSSEDF